MTPSARHFVAILIVAAALWGHTTATTTAAPSTGATTTAAAAPTTTATAAPTGPTLPPLSTEVSRADLLFTFFAQDDTVVQEYSRAVAALLNVTIRRVKFESTGQGRYGYLFGENVRVRVLVDPPVASEDEQRPSVVIRDALVELAVPPTHATLSDIGIVSGERVDSLGVYTYSPFTAWDVVWTLLIAAGGAGFLGFLGFVGYRFNQWRKFEKRERELAAKEKEMQELKQKAQSKGGAAASKNAKKAAAEERAALLKRLDEEDDGDDVADETMADLVNQLAKSVQRQQQGGYAVSSSNGASPEQAFAESEAFTAPTDRVAMGESQLGPADIGGRQALQLAHHQQYNENGSPPRAKTAVESYLDRIVLPPTTPPATHIPGVDPKAPPPSQAPSAAGGAASTAGGSTASPTSRGAATSSGVATSALRGFPDGAAATTSSSSGAAAPSPAAASPSATSAAQGAASAGLFSKRDMDEL